MRVIAHLLSLLAALTPLLARADTCWTPSPLHSTLSAAIADAACTDIVIEAPWMQAGVVDRSLAIRGSGSQSHVIAGPIRVEGDTTELRLEGLSISAPGSGSPFYWVVAVGGARVITADVILTVPTVIFADGFEGAGTAAWSTSVP